MKTLRLTLLAIALALTGCATSSKTSVKNIDWSTRIGSYTYEQALAELGKPDVISESSEGRTAEWVIRRSSNVSFGLGFGTSSYGHSSAAGVGVGTAVSPPPSGEYLHLRFDKDGKLAEWTKVKY